MRLLVLNCGPHASGNSATIARQICNAAASRGTEVVWMDAGAMDITACQGCNACRKQGKCKIEDDMTKVVEEMARADVVLFAAPIYMAGICGQGKCLLDRLNGLLTDDMEKGGMARLPPGKRAVTLLTCGLVDGDKIYSRLNVDLYRLFDTMLGFDFVLSAIVPSAALPEDIL
ncbi:MAG TPA: flavodoxin family protein, partial [Methanomassiliicoccales archaeon]|nr:flavodoxin family protein [Methanomassiliicoccales archaeon]